MNTKLKQYWTLFISTFTISAFTFGGGFVIIPLLKKKFCDELAWIEEDEILDLIAVAQSSPGALAVNTSMIIGYRVLGISGAIVAAFSTVLPPFIILSVVSLFYSFFRDNKVVSALLKGMQAGVAAVIIDVVINMGTKIIKKKELVSIALMIVSFILTFFFNINLYFIILLGAVTGIIYNVLRRNKEKSL